MDVLLKKDILTNDAEINDAATHILRNVVIPEMKNVTWGTVTGGDQIAPVGLESQTHRGQELHASFGQPSAFLYGDSCPLYIIHTCTRSDRLSTGFVGLSFACLFS